MHTLTVLLSFGYLLSLWNQRRRRLWGTSISVVGPGDVFELMERMDGLSFMESVSLLFKRPAYSFLLS